jgi:hypothetical protein
VQLRLSSAYKGDRDQAFPYMEMLDGLTEKEGQWTLLTKSANMLNKRIIDSQGYRLFIGPLSAIIGCPYFMSCVINTVCFMKSHLLEIPTYTSTSRQCRAPTSVFNRPSVARFVIARFVIARFVIALFSVARSPVARSPVTRSPILPSTVNLANLSLLIVC